MRILPKEKLKLSFRQKIHHSLMLLISRREIKKNWNKAWPEGRKAFRLVFREMHELVWKYNCKKKNIIYEYFSQGLHREDHPLTEYCLAVEWKKMRYILDYNMYPEILKSTANKITFKKRLEERGYTTSQVIGILKNDNNDLIVRKTNGSGEVPLYLLLQETGGVFVKPDDMLQGIGCAKILPASNGEFVVNGKLLPKCVLVRKIQNRVLIVERLVENHPSIAAFHPESLNTLRIITMRTPAGGIEVNRAIMRFGCDGSTIDNLARGGIAVPVTSQGYLMDYGHRKDITTPPYSEHPNTGISFSGFRIPYWQESVELVMKCCKEICPELFNVGFDVAITPSGPVIIEANPNSDFFQRAGAQGRRPILNTWLKPLVEEFLKGNPIPY